MHLLLLYDYVENMAELRQPYREQHLKRIAGERDEGRIVMGGPLGDPEPTGAAIVFTDVGPDHVEEFVRGDPYVEAGLVTAWRIEPWKVV
jgi:uncharacterized protein YciI